MHVPAPIGRWLPRIKRPARSLRRAFEPAGIILVYHRLADEKRDPHRLAVSPSNFSRHLRHLRRTCDPLSLSELVACVGDGRVPRRAVVLTFDDGYVDNLRTAKPILEDAGIPATVFVTTGYTDGSKEFWWDRLEQLLVGAHEPPPRLELRVAGIRREWPTATAEERDRAHRGVHALLRPLADAEREDLLATLCRWAGRSPEPRPLRRAMTSSELRDLADGGLIDVGAHTISHPVLATLSREEQREELLGSKRMLEQVLGRAVSTCAFPYGKAGDFDERTLRIAEELGFESACTGVPGTVTRGTHRFHLPRANVTDCDGDRFARILEYFFLT